MILTRPIILDAETARRLAEHCDAAHAFWQGQVEADPQHAGYNRGQAERARNDAEDLRAAAYEATTEYEPVADRA